MKITRVLKASVLCLASAGSVFGAGFSLFEGSAAGIADPVYGAAKGGEPAAMFANPAAIAGLKGTQLQLGISLVRPDFAVEGVNPYTAKHTKAYAKDLDFFIPHFYLTQEISDDLTFGLGVWVPFGMGTDLGGEWFGRYNSYFSDIMTVNVTPVIAWQVNDWLAVSAGFTVQYFDITLKQKIDAANRTNNPDNPRFLDVDQAMSADSFGFGANLGLVVKPVDGLSVGLAYSSRIKHSAEGEAKYKRPAPVGAALTAAGQGFLFTDTTVKGSVTLPDTIVSAVTYDVNDKLTLGVGVTMQTWSTYDELRIRFEKPVVGAYEAASEKDWKDVFRYAAGGTYKASDSWTFRASYTYDTSPCNAKHIDYILPSGDRHIFAIGAGYTTGAWTIDASYFHEFMANDTVTEHTGRVGSGVMPSKYVDGVANCYALSFTYRF